MFFYLKVAISNIFVFVDVTTYITQGSTKIFRQNVGFTTFCILM